MKNTYKALFIILLALFTFNAISQDERTDVFDDLIADTTDIQVEEPWAEEVIETYPTKTNSNNRNIFILGGSIILSISSIVLSIVAIKKTK